MRFKHIIVIALFLPVLLSYPFSKSSYGFNKGQVYNKEAQNIVNTADLIIKAERAYSQNTGEFADLSNLEHGNPPYLSPLGIYGYGSEECVKKMLLQSYVYICASAQTAELNVFMPNNFASSNMVVQEISKGITGEAGQISCYNGLADISFNLADNTPSFASNLQNSGAHSNAAPPVVSIVASPNANGGTSYINTGRGRNNIINQIISAVTGFFAAVSSLF
jgi:hypothetical protein